jgi:N6-L-threonylcarbamoyladenine synthase
MEDWLLYKIIGQTKDDAAGEAFDKVARILGLPYPGGPEISRLAAQTTQTSTIALPRPMLHSGDFNFSFSGLKTAVLYGVQKEEPLTEEKKQSFAREFQEAVVEVLVTKTIKAAEAHGAQSILLGGGVSANTRLREALKEKVHSTLPGVALYVPERKYSTDNAVMIGIAGYFAHTQKRNTPLVARGNLSF